FFCISHISRFSQETSQAPQFDHFLHIPLGSTEPNLLIVERSIDFSTPIIMPIDNLSLSAIFLEIFAKKYLGQPLKFGIRLTFLSITFEPMDRFCSSSNLAQVVIVQQTGAGGRIIVQQTVKIKK